MRIIVHDAKLLTRAYIDNDEDFFRKVCMSHFPDDRLTQLEYVNQIFRFDGFHQFIYDYETLEAELLNVGFSEVRQASFRDSTDPELKLDLDLPDREIQSLYIEAIAQL